MILVEQARVLLPVDSGDRVEARRVYCVGRNFAAHAREMGGDPDREAPFFFAKPRDALCSQPRGVPMPPATASLHHEVELALVLRAGGAALEPEQAEACIGWAAVAVDLTRRDLQAAAKAAGRPWAMAKGFDHSAPIGSLVRWAGSDAMADACIALTVDGAERQAGRLNQMIWTPAELLSQLSRLVRLAAGDVVLCGTPAGVGPLDVGAQVEAEIAGLPRLGFAIVASEMGLLPGGDACESGLSPDGAAGRHGG